MELTDRNLIDAHLKGDDLAFTEIVCRYADSILGYLTKMTANRQQAEDFFQETFQRVHQKAHTFRGQALGPWLFRIATNVAMNGFRRERKYPKISLEELGDCNGSGLDVRVSAVADNSTDPAVCAIRAEQLRQVREAIELLPARQRAALVLAYYQKLSYTQVAEVMGCSAGTVKTQMFRALKSLAGRLPDIAGGVQ